MAKDTVTRSAPFPRTVGIARPATSGTASALSAFERTAAARSRWWWLRTISPLVWLCLGILTIFVVCGALADVIAPYDPAENDLRARLQPPAFTDGGSTTHLLGTDQLGRDLLTRLIYGA